MAQPAVWIFGYGSLVHTPNFAYVRRLNGYIKNYKRVFHQGSTDHRGTIEAPGRTVTLAPEPGAVTWGTAFQLGGSPDEQQETLRYLEWREKQYDERAIVDVFGPSNCAIQEVETVTSTVSNAQSHTRQDLNHTNSHPNADTTPAPPTPNQAGVLQPSQPSSYEYMHASASSGTTTTTTYTAMPSATADPDHDDPDQCRAAHAAVHVVEVVESREAEEDVVLVSGALTYIATPDLTRNVNYLGPASLEAIAQQVATSQGPSGPNCEYVYKLANAMRAMRVHDAELFALESLVRKMRGERDHENKAGAIAVAVSNSGNSADERAKAAANVGVGVGAGEEMVLVDAQACDACDEDP